MLFMKVPNGLGSSEVALTEPTSVGLHAVEMSRVTPRQGAAEAEIDVTPMITGHVDLDGVANAFENLRDPQRQAKVLVVP